MTSKRKNYQIERRQQRRKEKNSIVIRDVTLGKCCRRGYGIGIAK